jgi:hypothetical protein
MVILVEVEARSWPGRVVTVLSDEAVDGAEADTLLTTEDTMERSTRVHISHGVFLNRAAKLGMLHLLFSCRASSLGSAAIFSSKSA